MESLALCRLLGVWLFPSKDAPTTTSLLADESWLPIRMIVQRSSSDWNADSAGSLCVLLGPKCCRGLLSPQGSFHLKLMQAAGDSLHSYYTPPGRPLLCLQSAPCKRYKADSV